MLIFPMRGFSSFPISARVLEEITSPVLPVQYTH